jgi:RNA recognition motif-containing protein
MLPKHQHAGRIVHGIETLTFDEKMAREVELLQGAQLNTMSGKDAPLPAGATSALVVQSLAYATTEEDLKAAFEKYGDVKRVKILTKDDGSSKGTGFVNFTKPEHAAKGLNAMQGIELNGRALKVKFKEDRGDGQSKGGGSRACFSCGQEGHISRNCPSKDSSQGGGSGTNDDNSQVQTVGNGWDTTGGKTAGGHEWASGGGDIATQELTNGWGNAGNDATANSSGW